MTAHGWRSPRCWLALLVLVAAWFAVPVLEDAIRGPPAHFLHLHMIDRGALSPGPFAWFMTVRGLLDLALLASIAVLVNGRSVSFPLVDPCFSIRLPLGMIVGLFVMIGAILAIIACGDAHVTYSGQPIWLATVHGVGWLMIDLVGAVGEEMYGRGAVLLVAAAFLGWRGAIIVSGLLFSFTHLGSPGASSIWLLRLFFQGALLAYAVFRTGSLWWSVGYHTGWNWASAPLFGAAGSGYLDAGHLFDFTPVGPTLITGGAVGPEGSLFAFAAVFAAAVILVLTTRRSAAPTIQSPPRNLS